MTGAFLLPLVLAAAPVSSDPGGRSVTFTATATGCATNAPLEFMFVGPNSDRDYEALFVTDASLADIAAACAQAGFPPGHPVDAKACVFRACGETVELSPGPADFLVDAQRPGAALPDAIYTGGARTETGALLAGQTMPAAFFALYDCGQSPLQFDEVLDQSRSYGRFLPKRAFKKGERRAFTLKWSGTPNVREKTLNLSPETARRELDDFSRQATNGVWNVLAAFDGSFTVRQAVAVAKALEAIDSPAVKINGVREGQFYFRAFLPLPQWRDASLRLAQPPEVHFGKEDALSVTHFLEDWSLPGATEPKLTAATRSFSKVEDAAAYALDLVGKSQTMLLYASPAEKLRRLYEFRRAVAGDAVLNWYVFAE